MGRALLLAERSLGLVSPNPAVGAVISRDGVIVGEGWTQPPGQLHAEVMALQQAGDKAAGAVLYTTLEPCCHQGRTSACVPAIIDAGISKVHAAMVDPNPLVSGKGLMQLNEAGIYTLVGEGECEARKLTEAYLKFITTGLPFVTAKFAMSLDGKIATRSGDSQWITGHEARRYAQVLRATSDAIMVGINTVIVDDPLLTARDETGRPLERQPLRVVVDSNGRLSNSAKLLSQPGQTLVAVADPGMSKSMDLANINVEVKSISGTDGLVDLIELIRILGSERDVTSIFVEGGGSLLGSLFDLSLVDKVVAFVAPVVIGGREAISPVEGKGIETMAETLRLQRVDVLRLDSDIAIVGYR